MGNKRKFDHKCDLVQSVRSLVDLHELYRPSKALHNELQFGGPRGPKALFFNDFLPWHPDPIP
jgi:hypothetical protein